MFLAVAVYFKEQKRADEIVQQRREEIEAELPRFVNTIEQELRASRDVLNILKSYQRNAGHAMKRELEITIADMASGNEENALTRMESRIGSTMLSDVVRGLISVKRGDNGIMYFQMLSMTFKQLELQKLKLEAMKQPGKMRKYSFMLLGCFLLMYLGVWAMWCWKPLANCSKGGGETVKRLLKDKRGEGFVDVCVLVLAIAMVLALVVRIAPVFVAKQNLDVFADELVRTAEINGQVGSATNAKAADLREQTGLDPNISWSDTGKIQLGNEVEVTSQPPSILGCSVSLHPFLSL